VCLDSGHVGDEARQEALWKMPVLQVHDVLLMNSRHVLLCWKLVVSDKESNGSIDVNPLLRDGLRSQNPEAVKTLLLKSAFVEGVLLVRHPPLLVVRRAEAVALEVVMSNSCLAIFSLVTSLLLVHREGLVIGEHAQEPHAVKLLRADKPLDKGLLALGVGSDQATDQVT